MARSALAGWLVLLLAAGASAEPWGRPGRPPLQVPYLPQTEALCGGAAAAMVMRYWGAHGVAPADFAPLIEPALEGIPTRALVSAVAARGWRAFAFSGSAAMARHHLGRGRPLVMLIEVAPGRLHYVVVVAWTGDRLLVHDPASLPNQRMTTEAFERAWTASSRWTLLILPPDDRRPPTPSAERSTPVPGRPPVECADQLRRGVSTAAAGQLDAAESWLLEARTSCPAAAAPYRELAGLRLLQRQYADAVELAQVALARDGTDAHAWRTLGTAHYLGRNAGAALDAWNAVAEPVIDLVQVEGLRRTRYAVAADSLGLRAGSVLSADDLGRAERRLASLPAVEAARLGYSPRGGGLVRVDAVATERPLMPVSRLELAAAGVRAVTDRRVDWYLSSPTGSGELLTASWRWWANRPRVALGMSVPVGGRLPGVLEIQGLWEEQAYRAGGLAGDAPRDLVRERRRTLLIQLSGWRSGAVRWELGGGAERWEGRGTSARLGVGVELRPTDRLAAYAATTLWGGTDRFTAFRAATAWRSGAPAARQLLTMSAGLALTSSSAPPDVWPGAGTGHARTPLLRAHPLVEGGVIAGAAFGRHLAHATGEYRHRLWRAGPVEVGLAAFADAARAREGFAPTRAHVDAGAGVRLGVAGRAIRLDVARGLVDGRTAVSAGWVLPWPAFR